MAFTVLKTRGEFAQNVVFADIFWYSPIGKSKIFQVFSVGEFEYSFHYPVVFRNGERRKTRVFWNSPFG